MKRNIVPIAIGIFLTVSLLVCQANATSLPGHFQVTETMPFDRAPALIEMGPDGKLYIFFAGSGGGGGGVALDPIDGIFFNGNDTISSGAGGSGKGAAFTPDGKLLRFYHSTDVATLIDPVDGVFRNGNDSILDFTWPFGILDTNSGTAVKHASAFGPDGIFYVPKVGPSRRLAVFDPIDGDLTNDNFSYSEIDLPSEFGGRPWHITFDNNGIMFIANHYAAYDHDEHTVWDAAVLMGIDPVDSVFFNGDDITRSYSIGSIIQSAGLTSLTGHSHVFDIAFDPSGNLLMWDADTRTLFAAAPGAGPPPPPPIPEPATVLLLGSGLLGLGAFRKKFKK